jgi:hypothetical protein
MSELKDNTTERDESSPPKKERPPGSYYYDDSTGYEIFDPSLEDDEDETESVERETPDD